jgi:predicted nuclease of predicted toxin-antitoxin system
VAGFPLLLDEDVAKLLAKTLRGRGFDVVHAFEAGLAGRPDEAVMGHAVTAHQTVMTHNVRHFVPLAKTYDRKGDVHFGVVLAPQLEFRELLAATTKLLMERTAPDMVNLVIWLP